MYLITPFSSPFIKCRKQNTFYLISIYIVWRQSSQWITQLLYFVLIWREMRYIIIKGYIVNAIRRIRGSRDSISGSIWLAARVWFESRVCECFNVTLLYLIHRGYSLWLLAAACHMRIPLSHSPFQLCKRVRAFSIYINMHQHEATLYVHAEIWITYKIVQIWIVCTLKNIKNWKQIKVTYCFDAKYLQLKIFKKI